MTSVFSLQAESTPLPIAALNVPVDESHMFLSHKNPMSCRRLYWRESCSRDPKCRWEDETTTAKRHMVFHAFNVVSHASAGFASRGVCRDARPEELQGAHHGPPETALRAFDAVPTHRACAAKALRRCVSPNASASQKCSSDLDVIKHEKWNAKDCVGIPVSDKVLSCYKAQSLADYWKVRGNQYKDPLTNTTNWTDNYLDSCHPFAPLPADVEERHGLERRHLGENLHEYYVRPLATQQTQEAKEETLRRQNPALFRQLQEIRRKEHERRAKIVSDLNKKIDHYEPLHPCFARKSIIWDLRVEAEQLDTDSEEYQALYERIKRLLKRMSDWYFDRPDDKKCITDTITDKDALIKFAEDHMSDLLVGTDGECALCMLLMRLDRLSIDPSLSPEKHERIRRLLDAAEKKEIQRVEAARRRP